MFSYGRWINCSVLLHELYIVWYNVVYWWMVCLRTEYNEYRTPYYKYIYIVNIGSEFCGDFGSFSIQDTAGAQVSPFGEPICVCLWNVINLHHISSQIVVKSDHDGFKATFLSSFLVLSYQCSSEYAHKHFEAVFLHTSFFFSIISSPNQQHYIHSAMSLSSQRADSSQLFREIVHIFDTDCSLGLKILLISGPFFEKIWKLTVAAQCYVCWNSMRSGKSDVCIENSHEVFVVLRFS